ncbi:formylmethanofuran--tetrahydromethanopterin N-formyltransferase [Ancylobacter dichloromethanicus]|uniref:Formylmethanofuran--tetrahydromethanopterin formyltransferase n=1 Tax=Ancylobacter dichloromethanicus TaxID=518825 RepID=A0A9W6J3D3_9HYPH|nr:formylmethanofuran--tetrahydromethanopterin N-formyltransferase [Ancylobacter dichloromethanicus]MBS7556193.1 formylmethanofuran--tetrahydromethanopterin N-formyltransferase [Ancylobacter dichloromethanicus]GLK69947.1 formylmethanofuran--tetrahydromethanopterin formyltransferase [Ancylobacter dichloromethanicus]
MILNGVEIRDTFAEAFPMVGTRLIVTADTPEWALIAGRTTTGFATSVIGCGCEAGIERTLTPEETPDRRPGVSLLIFAMDFKQLKKVVPLRLGQCVLTCPTTACYAGIETGKRVPLAKTIRYFADGHQISKKIGDKRFWRLPVMEGEFVCDEDTGSVEGVGGGNFLILARSRGQALRAAEAAVAAMGKVEGIILPFPGGVVRSGSKVGSKYKGLFASTNDAYCPTLRGTVPSHLPAEVGSVLEIVIDGVSFAAVAEATKVGISAVCALGSEGGVVAIDAGNYGGTLGPFHFKLREIMQNGAGETA